MSNQIANWPLTILLVSLHLWLLVRLYRSGVGLLFYPAFSILMSAIAVGWILRACGMYTAHLVLHAVLIPVKFWAFAEAVKMRARLLIDSTPRMWRGKELHGETWLLGQSAIRVALVAMTITLYFAEAQYNAPKYLVIANQTAGVGVTTLLVVTWAYFEIRKAASPRISKAHHLLLTLWFALYTGVNFVKVGPGEGEKWWALNYGSMMAGTVLLSGWVWLFRDRVSVARPAPGSNEGYDASDAARPQRCQAYPASRFGGPGSL